MAEPRITAEGFPVCGCRGLSDCFGRCFGVDRDYLAFSAVVDDFAAEIKAKFLDARAKGRGGWDAGDWSEDCKRMLHEHIDKGDARDVGVLAAFLFNMREV